MGNFSGFGTSAINADTNLNLIVDETCTPPGAATVNNTAHLVGDSSSVTVQGPQTGTNPITGLPIYAQYEFACVTGVGLDASAKAKVSCEELRPPGLPDACTYTQGGYQGGGVSGTIYTGNFTTVFSSGLTIGINDGGGSKHHALWNATGTGQTALKTFLGGGGPSGALTADTADATSVSGGALAKQTAALALNMGFDAAGFLPNGVQGFGSLQVCNTVTGADGKTGGGFSRTPTRPWGTAMCAAIMPPLPAIQAIIPQHFALRRHSHSKSCSSVRCRRYTYEDSQHPE